MISSYERYLEARRARSQMMGDLFAEALSAAARKLAGLWASIRTGQAHRLPQRKGVRVGT